MTTLNQFINNHLFELQKSLRAMFIQVWVYNGTHKWDGEFGSFLPEMVLCTYEIPTNGKFQEYHELSKPVPIEWRAAEMESPDAGRMDVESELPYFHTATIWFNDGSWSEVVTEGEDDRYVWLHHGTPPTFPNHWRWEK